MNGLFKFPLALAVLTGSGAALALQPDAELVGQAVNRIQAGQAIDDLAGMPEISEDKRATLKTLEGCTPRLADYTTAQYVNIVFRCESESALPTDRTVTFNFDGSDLKYVALDLVPIAIGPTLSAIETDKIEKPKNTFKAFIKAVRQGADATLGGIVPLGESQKQQLVRIQKCSWEIGDFQTDARRVAVAECRELEGRPAFIVIMNFDKQKRPVSVEIDLGQKIVTESYSRTL